MERQSHQLNNSSTQITAADQVIDITFYTDPLCCWSWIMQPQLLLVQSALGEQASWHLKMGGLIPDWTHFQDEANAVSRPAQMAPIWMHAAQVAGIDICHRLWITDAPATSYPSCIAVKCAQLQSSALAALMLWELQNACMSGCVNIAKKDALFKVAL